jgi:hypothetical protein
LLLFRSLTFRVIAFRRCKGAGAWSSHGDTALYRQASERGSTACSRRICSTDRFVGTDRPLTGVRPGDLSFPTELRLVLVRCLGRLMAAARLDDGSFPPAGPKFPSTASSATTPPKASTEIEVFENECFDQNRVALPGDGQPTELDQVAASSAAATYSFGIGMIAISTAAILLGLQPQAGSARAGLVREQCRRLTEPFPPRSSPLPMRPTR